MSQPQHRRYFKFGKIAICQAVSTLPHGAWQLGKLYIGVWGICQAQRLGRYLVHGPRGGMAMSPVHFGGQ